MKFAYMYVASFAGLVAACASETEQASSASAVTTRAGMCTDEQRAAAYEKMINAPIKPPRYVADIDLLGGAGFTPVSIFQVEATHCQSNPLFEADGDVGVTFGPADSSAVQITYDNATKKLNQFTLNVGYKGSLDFASRPNSLSDPAQPNPFGSHTYSIGIGRPILRDGAPWELDWTKACGEGVTDCWEKQSAEIYDALMYTFAPEVLSTQESCIANQTCLAKAYDNGSAIFGARPLRIYFYVANVAASANTPEMIYGFVR
jgi:hypothetical protein